MVAVGAGTLATLRSRQLGGRRVRVLAAEHEWVQRAIAASLEHNKRFAEVCWHVNAMFCLTRRFGSTEASCERWIGGLICSDRSLCFLFCVSFQCAVFDDAWGECFASLLHGSGGRAAFGIYNPRESGDMESGITLSNAGTYTIQCKARRQQLSRSVSAPGPPVCAAMGPTRRSSGTWRRS